MLNGDGGWRSRRRSREDDSYRFGLLMYQLYSDREQKSVFSSVINVLSRNKQLCSMLPRFVDNRKTKSNPLFIGWKDKFEPNCPIRDLMSLVIPKLQKFRRVRGVIQTPPHPPYPEIDPPQKTCKIIKHRLCTLPIHKDYSCSKRYNILSPTNFLSTKNCGEVASK